MYRLFLPGLCEPKYGTMHIGLCPQHETRTLPITNSFGAWEVKREKLVNASRVTPEQVGGQVLEVMLSRRPRLRYTVAKATIIASLRRHLPGELFERIYFGEFLRRMTATVPSHLRRPHLGTK